MKRIDFYTNCLNCEKPIKTTPKLVANGHGKYCSNHCKGIYLWAIPEYREKLVLKHKGRKYNDALNIFRAKGGKTKGSTGMAPWNKGLVGFMALDKNPNWRGGVSFIQYPPEFNSRLKHRIRERDGFSCVLCGKKESEELRENNRVLSVNHINFDKKDCREENLNTLCVSCNSKVNYNRDIWTSYFTNLLTKISV